MTYPENFVSAVKQAYPDSERLHSALDAGSDLVGRILNDTCHWAPNPRTVVQMIDEGRTDELRAEAEKHAVASELYIQWCQIADDQR